MVEEGVKEIDTSGYCYTYSSPAQFEQDIDIVFVLKETMEPHYMTMVETAMNLNFLHHLQSVKGKFGYNHDIVRTFSFRCDFVRRLLAKIFPA